MAPNPQQLERMRSSKGFIAALDQSGGSTPKALALYGVSEAEYSGEVQMFDAMHAMRSRMVKSQSCHPIFESRQGSCRRT